MADRPPILSGQMPSSFDDNSDFYNERPAQKIARKIKEEPLIPLGVGLTVFAFINSWRALRKGDSRQANRMFRARVAAQGFTVIAMVAGSMYYSKDREKSKELRKLKEERDAEEKRQKWIRELEVRDDEEKALRSRLQQKSLQAAEAAKAKVQEEEERERVNLEKAERAGERGTGGILGRMGLWSQAEQKAAEEQNKSTAAATVGEDAAVSDAAAEKKGKKSNNPKSSLGAIGEIVAARKGGETTKSSDDPNKSEPKK